MCNTFFWPSYLQYGQGAAQTRERKIIQNRYFACKIARTYAPGTPTTWPNKEHSCCQLIGNMCRLLHKHGNWKLSQLCIFVAIFNILIIRFWHGSFDKVLGLWNAIYANLAKFKTSHKYERLQYRMNNLCVSGICRVFTCWMTRTLYNGQLCNFSNVFVWFPLDSPILKDSRDLVLGGVPHHS